MKHILLRLTVAALAAAAVAGEEPGARSQESGVERRASAVGSHYAAPPRDFTIIRGQEPGITGQELVAQAAKRLANEKKISAELRYKIDTYGHELLGTGKYLQRGAGEDRLLRLDLRMQVGERPATLLEIRGSELLLAPPRHPARAGHARTPQPDTASQGAHQHACFH
jgi:hypothetical protein